MSDEFMKNRKPTKDELKLIKFLICLSSIKIPIGWEEHLTVETMSDGGMGSLKLDMGTNPAETRIFGKQISECHFVDIDGINVMAALNVDNNGNLFELDMWKVDFSPVQKIAETYIPN